MKPIDAALAALKSLEPGEKVNFTATAKQFGCNRSTLSKRYRGVQGSSEQRYEDQRLLNDQQAKTLVQWINTLTGRGLPPTHQMLRNFAKEISGKPAGKKL